MDLEPLSQQNKSISMCGKNWGREIQLSPLPTRRFQPPLLTLEDLASVTLKRACGSPYRNIIYCAEWRGKEIPTDTVRMTKPHIEFERSGKTDKKNSGYSSTNDLPVPWGEVVFFPWWQKTVQNWACFLALCLGSNGASCKLLTSLGLSFSFVLSGLRVIVLLPSSGIYKDKRS